MYCDYRKKHEQAPQSLLLSILKQLAMRKSSLSPIVRKLYDKHKLKGSRPALIEISSILQSVVMEYSRVFILVDALDECQSSDGVRSRFMSQIFSLQGSNEDCINVFATSRPIPEIRVEFERRKSKMVEIRAHDEDIHKYLHGHLSQLPSFVSSSPGLEERIKDAIIRAADGM